MYRWARRAKNEADVATKPPIVRHHWPIYFSMGIA